MELRVLQYFLAVAREQSISAAADFLHITQPTLSRQLKELEDEVGRQLFIRGNRQVTLTEEGMLLRKRAGEIIELVQKTQSELTLFDDALSGDVLIGAAETDSARLLSRAARRLTQTHPGVRFHLISGDMADILERLDKGLLDFALVIGEVDGSKYESLPLPGTDVWGALMRRDNPLAACQSVTPRQLSEQPLIVSRQALSTGALDGWFHTRLNELNVVATYNLIYNAALMVEERLGVALTLDKLTNTCGGDLTFRPFAPALSAPSSIVWKRYQVFSKPAELFMQALRG